MSVQTSAQGAPQHGAARLTVLPGTPVPLDRPQVEAGALDQMFGILSQYTEALGKLNEVLRRAERDVGILEHKASERG